MQQEQLRSHIVSSRAVRYVCIGARAVDGIKLPFGVHSSLKSAIVLSNSSFTFKYFSSEASRSAEEKINHFLVVFSGTSQPESNLQTLLLLVVFYVSFVQTAFAWRKTLHVLRQCLKISVKAKLQGVSSNEEKMLMGAKVTFTQSSIL